MADRQLGRRSKDCSASKSDSARILIPAQHQKSEKASLALLRLRVFPQHFPRGEALDFSRPFQASICSKKALGSSFELLARSPTPHGDLGVEGIFIIVQIRGGSAEVGVAGEALHHTHVLHTISQVVDRCVA